MTNTGPPLPGSVSKAHAAMGTGTNIAPRQYSRVLCAKVVWSAFNWHACASDAQICVHSAANACLQHICSHYGMLDQHGLNPSATFNLNKAIPHSTYTRMSGSVCIGSCVTAAICIACAITCMAGWVHGGLQAMRPFEYTPCTCMQLCTSLHAEQKMSTMR